MAGEIDAEQLLFPFEDLARAGLLRLRQIAQQIVGAHGGRIDVESPLPGQVRLLRDGKEVARATGNRLSYPVEQAGVYRAEVWLELGGEWRAWVYSNPVYLR